MGTKKNVKDMASRLRDFRKTFRGGMTQQMISEALNIDQQRWSSYELGSAPSPVVLAGLMQLGARPQWLLLGEGAMMQHQVEVDSVRKIELAVASSADGIADERSLADFHVLPLYADEAAAGEPHEMRDTAIEGPAILHRAWCPNPDMTDYVRVASTGNSMEPTIPAGSIVTIDRTLTEQDALIGKIVAIGLRDDGVTLKRLRRTERGSYVGVPDNPTKTNRPIHLEEGDRIIGQVTTVHASLL